MSPRTKAAVMLTIDGKKLNAREGETVLDLGSGAGIDFFDRIVRPFVEHLLANGRPNEALQAVERAGTKAGNKGWDAAVSGLEMASLLKNMAG